MQGQIIINFFKQRVVGLLMMALAAIGLCVARAQSDSDLESGAPMIARVGGTTIVQGGTGKTGGFIPVLTTLAFHAEKAGNAVTGGFRVPCPCTAGKHRDGKRSVHR